VATPVNELINSAYFSKKSAFCGKFVCSFITLQSFIGFRLLNGNCGVPVKLWSVGRLPLFFVLTLDSETNV
jgi:hypothetical protein